MVKNPLVGPYFLGGGIGGVPLDSHDKCKTGRMLCNMVCFVPGHHLVQPFMPKGRSCWAISHGVALKVGHLQCFRSTISILHVSASFFQVTEKVT